MSTENEEWRENSFNEENTGAGRDIQINREMLSANQSF